MRLSTGVTSAFAKSVVRAAERHMPVALVVSFPGSPEPDQAFQLQLAQVKDHGGDRARMISHWQPIETSPDLTIVHPETAAGER